MVALAGGTTPRGLYARLADGAAPYRAVVPWERTHFFWGDERAVPPDHRDSNYHLASEALLQYVPAVEEQVHRIRGENPDAVRAAEEYEAILRDAFHLGSAEWPRFDLILLGMGEDGHTASLFPESAALFANDRLAIATKAPSNGDRITLTLPVLNAAATVIFLVSGEAKAATLKRLMAGEDLPAARVKPFDGDRLWLVDREAARLIAS
jgi:6-phosphogluconolactonase